MSRTRSVFLAFSLAIVLAMMLAGSAPAVPPENGSEAYEELDQVNARTAAVLQRFESTGGILPLYGGDRDPFGGDPQIEQMLTILVEFADGPERIVDDPASWSGPEHNQIPAPGARDNTSYWIADFNVAHYTEMLFGKTSTSKSMYTYYMEQSDGRYGVDGDVYGWYKLPHVEAYYGTKLNAKIVDLLKDAVALIGNGIDWSDYDLNHDGFVDHLQFVHAGIDESAGGPEWTIWAQAISLGTPVVAADGTGIDAFTVNPEDGTLGVFVHEYAHNIGVPDLYDTIYSGDASTGFWSLMGQGSWSSAPGEPSGTTPAPLGIWEKMLLGWVNEADGTMVVVNPGQKVTSVLRPTSRFQVSPKAIRVNLPNYSYGFQMNTPFSGSYEWWGGRGNRLDNTLSRSFSGLPAYSTLEFKTWYRIEQGWDYGYVQISDDGGANWTNLPGNITTNDDPHTQNLGNGITGSSDWTTASFSLAGYSGNVQIRFRYWTDQNTFGDGWTWDDLTITYNNGASTFFTDDVGSTVSDWTSDGWSIITGRPEALNYYMVEWREPIGYDLSMNSWYNWVDYGLGLAEFFRAYPGALIWYRTTEFGENWVGRHPWRGFLMVVDSKPQYIQARGTEDWTKATLGVRKAAPVRTMISIADATFCTGLQIGQVLRSWYETPAWIFLPSGLRVSVFDDRTLYVDRTWEAFIPKSSRIRNSLNSVMTPTNGVKIRVNARFGSYLGGSVTVDYSKPVKQYLPWDLPK